jgi:hypothetical protein
MTKTLLGLALAAALLLFTVPVHAAPLHLGTTTVSATASPDHLVDVAPAPAVVLALESLDHHQLALLDTSQPALAATVHADNEAEPTYRRPDHLSARTSYASEPVHVGDPALKYFALLPATATRFYPHLR